MTNPTTAPDFESLATTLRDAYRSAQNQNQLNEALALLTAQTGGGGGGYGAGGWQGPPSQCGAPKHAKFKTNSFFF